MRRDPGRPSWNALLPFSPTRSTIWVLLCCAVAVVLATPPAPLSATAQEFYVAPNGRPDGDGSKDRPWDLVTALAQPSMVKPGDTIWLRGGRYVVPGGPWSGASFVSYLTGSPGASITVRQYPGERAILDSVSSAGSPLIVYGAWTTYWGFEVMISDPGRTANAPGPDPKTPRGQSAGVVIRGAHTKFINLIVHDTGHEAFFAGADIQDVELYGNIIFFNGWQGPDHGWGHGIYLGNDTGTKRVVDNLIFQDFGWGLHLYGSPPAGLNNFYVEGNIIFNEGELAGNFAANILIGGEYGSVANNPVVLNNYTYFSRVVGNGENNLGWVAGCTNPLLRNNYFAGGMTALKLANCANTTMTGNTFYGTTTGFTQADFPLNTYFRVRPTGVRIVVRPNQYEPGRAHIAVYNWDLWGAVAVDVSGILQIGARYEVRNAQDYFGLPVLTGTYDGRPLWLPMTGLRVAAPVGNVPVKPSPTGPEFAAFVLTNR